MILDVPLSVFAAVVLLILMSLTLTCLTSLYQEVFQRLLREKAEQRDLIASYLRFVADVTITLVLVMLLLMNIYVVG
ncbi:hypothetical protein [Solemya velesiana gill symbiont]|uniref:Uncharacterized protein n=1 Tax=Solemya velesiana gill symbiont TaxID=1918948 RepID=A0A1T2KU92_9GAMM|nr:hypothetical protein [Solemya velesiana gill symbiont]OOZ36425.1 hypothetical protein BOW51_07285 [Solemya velesiana gill symbiont]